MTSASGATLARVASRLATDETFGSSAPIVRRTCAFYRLGVETLARQSAALRPLRDALRDAAPDRAERVFGDPAVRHMLNAWLARSRSARQSPAAIEAIAGGARAFLTGECAATPLEAAVRPALRLGGAARACWVWHETHPPGDVTSYFTTAVETTFASHLPHLSLALEGAGDFSETLVTGAGLLDECLPEIWASVAPHVHCIALFRATRRPGSVATSGLPSSLSDSEIPASVFIDGASIADAWQAAEAVLHESLHQKFFDLWLARRLAGPPAASPASIHVPWRDSHWGLHRALGAFHVYVHLSVFFQVMARRAGEEPVARAGTAMRRAAHLGEEILRAGAGELRPQGVAFVEWLLAALAELRGGAVSPAGGSR